LPPLQIARQLSNNFSVAAESSRGGSILQLESALFI
jgi:hypothetical protein